MKYRWQIAVWMILSLQTAGQAGYVPKVEAVREGPVAAVKVNGLTALRLRAGNAGLSAYERAALVAARLQGWLTRGGGSLSLLPQGGSVWIVAGDERLVAATPQEARLAGLPTASLAASWRKALQAGLARPPLTADPGSVLIPWGETRQIRLGGVATGPVRVTEEAGIAVSEMIGDNLLRLRAVGVGRYKLILERQGAFASVWVTVKKPAGRLLGTPLAEVTGVPASSEAIAEAVQSALAASLALEPGAAWKEVGKPRFPGPLAPGESGEAQTVLELTGPGCLPVTLAPKVRVANRALPVKDTQLLMFSNDPERLTRAQDLFWGEMPVDAPARLMYHHQNAMAAPVQLVLDLFNRSSERAQVAILASPARPIVDTVLVGHLAAARFLRDLAVHSGYITEIGPGASLRLVSQRLERDRTGSGLFEFRQLTGSPLAVRVAAELPGQPVPAPPQEMAVNPAQLFPNPSKTVEARYTVGQPWAFIRVGKHPITGHEEAHRLEGNYGVLYRIQVTLANPTSERRLVSILFEPSAGAARGVFLIDGRFVQTNHLVPPREAPLAQVELAPLQEKRVSIQTVPLAGSAYPATIIVR